MGATWRPKKLNIEPLDGEQWRRVEGFDYLVSSFGRVASEKSGRLLSPFVRHHGYLHVTLRRDGKSHGFSVHRLVAAAFVGPLSDDQVVNHKDFDTANNRDMNLEICTQRDNCHHAAKAGRMVRGDAHWMRQRPPLGELHNRSKLTNETVAEIRRKLGAGVRSIDIAAQHNVSKGCIADIKAGRTWSHVVV